jgi:hypothetical protein
MTMVLTIEPGPQTTPTVRRGLITIGVVSLGWVDDQRLL